MPQITIQISDEVADELTRQARSLLLGRRQYVRAVLAAIAEQAKRGHPTHDTVGHDAPTAAEPGRAAQ